VTLSLAHLTFVDVPPPELVTIAAAAGFDAVGLRLIPARHGEAPWPVIGPTPMRQELDARLRATGLGVLDVEAVRLTPDIELDLLLPVFEAAGELGARFAVVSGLDEDEPRLTDRFAELSALATPFGVRPMLEPMAYSAVRSVAAAARIVRAAGAGGVLVDALHMRRTGGTTADVEMLKPQLVPYVQVCDAPHVAPAGGLEATIDESRHRRLVPGTGDLPLEALLAVTPPGAPVSVEAPSHALRDELGTVGHARRLREATAELLLAARA
jgi:sugar phosphate isomerase/epimerase